jgi:transposase
LDDRKVLAGIIFVLRTGIPWEDLPQEMGCGSGMTCWRRHQQWQALGIWRRLQQILLDRLRGEGKLDFSRVAADIGSIGEANGRALQVVSGQYGEEGGDLRVITESLDESFDVQ